MAHTVMDVLITSGRGRIILTCLLWHGCAAGAPALIEFCTRAVLSEVVTTLMQKSAIDLTEFPYFGADRLYTVASPTMVDGNEATTHFAMSA
jgi:hypothetical protein